MTEVNLWRFILERINLSQPVILLCVLDSHGSSPGRRGFKMAVASDSLYGSIGGGIMEHKFAEMAKEKLRTYSDETLIKKQIHSKAAKHNQSGMICSGEQTILLYPVTSKHTEVVSQIINSLSNNKKGRLKISSEGISFSETVSDDNYIFEMKSEDDWEYQENTGYKNHLYIVGGGHCGLAFSRLMSSMDFYVHLYDDRNGLNTFEENSYAHEKRIIPDYSSLKEIIPSGDNVYVVIMTFGYRTDDIALRSIIEKNFKYLGVLGSQTKMKKMFEEWRNDKLPEEKLGKIFSPIGVSINSQSPEEIAVSIAAEIISVKNGDKSNSRLAN